MFVVRSVGRGGRRAARDLLRRSIFHENDRKECKSPAAAATADGRPRRTWVCSAEAPSNRFALLGVSCNNNVHYLLYRYALPYYYIRFTIRMPKVRVTDECLFFVRDDVYTSIIYMPNIKHSDVQVCYSRYNIYKENTANVINHYTIVTVIYMNVSIY